MAFIDKLRSARTSKTTVLHKFLTQYDPRAKRVYLFVEGDADQAFYRAQLSRHLPEGVSPFFYNCEGKKRVFDAYADILSRYPHISTALFFVDKDLDDILGRPWPSDPRIFTTDLYAIENYAVARACFERYLSDHVKIRNVELESAVLLDQFDEQLAKFHKLSLPIMAWILIMRRQGESVILNDVDFGKLFRLDAGELKRRSKRGTLNYLKRVTQCSQDCDWRTLRQASLELSRFAPKRYIRGKFEAWWFVAFVNHICDAASRVAAEQGGAVVRVSQLSSATMIQLLSESAIAPTSLSNFFTFHFGSLKESATSTQERTSLIGKIRALLGRSDG